eukprot:10025385-Alexandrium_andersonii.AAC.1
MSRLLHGAQIWGTLAAGANRQLEAVQTDALARILRRPQHLSRQTARQMREELGVPSVHWRVT